MPEHHALGDDIALMNERADRHGASAAEYEAAAEQAVKAAENLADNLVREAREKAADLVRQAQEQAGAHVNQAQERAAQIRYDRDQHVSRERYWRALAAEESVKAGLPPGPPPTLTDGSLDAAQVNGALGQDGGRP
jgi:cell division septum initiation protein DivIVA